MLKPINIEKLKAVLYKAVQKVNSTPQEFIIINKERQKKKLFLKDIYYFEIIGRVIHVHGTENTFLFYEQIGVLENKLYGKGFFRCHKSYLINLEHVDTYDRQNAILDNGEKIVIANRRYELFCKETLNFMKKGGGII